MYILPCSYPVSKHPFCSQKSSVLLGQRYHLLERPSAGMDRTGCAEPALMIRKTRLLMPVTAIQTPTPRWCPCVPNTYWSDSL